MSEGTQQEMSHADRHDLDKLERWKAGLDTADADDASRFPACAIFLVTGEDRASHDIFRRYRSAFEELGGGFHHLVIFGQHGVSTTQVAFLKEVGLGNESVPLLTIAPMAGDSGSVYCIELPKGDLDTELDDSQAWGAALKAVRSAAMGEKPLSFGGIDGVTSSFLSAGGLTATVDGALESLGD